MARTCFKICKNRNHSSRNNDTIEGLEGVYLNLDVAIDRAFEFRFRQMPDGEIRLYDRDATDLEIENDPWGYEAVGVIVEVSK
jgi:hypothetical protein